MRSPVSVLSAPVPTASMVPVLGFSLPVSGRKMPLAVLVSGSSRRTSTLSPRGRTFTLVLGAVAVFDISSSPVRGESAAETAQSSTHKSGQAGPAPAVMAEQAAAQGFEEEVNVGRGARAVEAGEGVGAEGRGHPAG